MNEITPSTVINHKLNNLLLPDYSTSIRAFLLRGDELIPLGLGFAYDSTAALSDSSTLQRERAANYEKL